MVCVGQRKTVPVMRGEAHQKGCGYICSRLMDVAKALFQKVPTSENSSGEILVLGRRLSYCLWKTPSHFRSQHSSSDATGLQNVILVNPLPSWNYRVSDLQGTLNIIVQPPAQCRFFSTMLIKGRLYLLVFCSDREVTELWGSPFNIRPT